MFSDDNSMHGIYRTNDHNWIEITDSGTTDYTWKQDPLIPDSFIGTPLPYPDGGYPPAPTHVIYTEDMSQKLEALEEKIDILKERLDDVTDMLESMMPQLFDKEAD